MCGIGIELCVNEDGNFESTFENAARLTARLLQLHQLELSAVRQHNDYNGKNCPRRSGRTAGGRNFWAGFPIIWSWNKGRIEKRRPFPSERAALYQ